jgi:uncharacterized protein YfiM (DUF2279 family)
MGSAADPAGARPLARATLRSNVTTAGRGACAGAIASVATGLVFLAARRTGTVMKVAPEEITETALDSAGVDASEPTDNAIATVSHLAFGAAAGAGYALIQQHLRLRPAAGGLGFAGLLLVASYEGWVPAVGALPPLHEQTRGQRWTLVAGHVVYGIVLGKVTSIRSDNGPSIDHDPQRAVAAARENS